ncbi:putative sodium-coupled neutral amino acid transporter 8a [Trichomycterus rosablanca]|uniref:putative sodium-coupled neutral amino acid transporter 8a n=1 Tax=Trichomycterus rosablanca TaxID=2290929 RepID=UPI002F35EF09
MKELKDGSFGFLEKQKQVEDRPGLGTYEAVIIILKSALGAGVLNFPWAFARAGGIEGAVTLELISLIFLVCGLIIMGYASSISGQNTYQTVVQKLCGATIGKLCEICFVFNIFMVCVAVLVVVAELLQKLSVSIYQLITGLHKSEIPYYWYMDQRFTLFLLCLFVILPLSISKDIGTQKYMSLLGSLASAYLAVAIVVRYYTIPKDHLPQFCSSGMESWHSIFNILPTICFGFQCHEGSVAIYSSLENKKLLNWSIISLVSMVICFVLYTIIGIYGYLTFGNHVAADILMSYSERDILLIIARVLVGVSVITVYPIMLLLGRSAILDPLLQYRERLHFSETKYFEICSRVVLTVTWILLTLLIAVFAPDISKVINLIAGTCSFFIFVFPGLCLIYAMQSYPVSTTLRWLLTAWGLITILCGAFIFGQSTSIAVTEVFYNQ